MRSNKSLHRTATAPRLVLPLAKGFDCLVQGEALSDITVGGGADVAGGKPSLAAAVAGELRATRRPPLREGRSLRSLGSPLNARPFGG